MDIETFRAMEIGRVFSLYIVRSQLEGPRLLVYLSESEAKGAAEKLNAAGRFINRVFVAKHNVVKAADGGLYLVGEKITVNEENQELREKALAKLTEEERRALGLED